MGTRPIQSKIYRISDGDSGIYMTAVYMWLYALRDMRENLVKQLVNSLRGSNDIDTIRNIFNWVWRNVEYKLDPKDREQVKAPIHFVNGNLDSGDCDCMTTLLVCLLEAAGFESAIKVIAWRKAEYTHVYAEVWYNNTWYTLDPTLKSDGFGHQDKKILRSKRITKNDIKKMMDKLNIDGLSDTAFTSNNSIVPRQDRLSSEQIERYNNQLRYPHRVCRRNANDDWNRNTNNININFGTTTENAYNTTDSSSNSAGGGVPVDVGSLPALHSIYDYRPVPQRPQRPIILRPRVDGKGYEVVDNINVPQQIQRPQHTQPPIITGGVSKAIALESKVVLGTVRPKYIPSSVKNYYPEFP